MKANELMIGDWVNHKGIYNQITPADFDYNHRKWIEEIEPIPLTEEILKKNGFKITINDHLTSVKYSFVEDVFSIVIYDFKHVIINSVDTNSKYDGFINYVHELQHALRLCKIINAEIII